MPNPTVIIDISAIAYPNDGTKGSPDWHRIDEAVSAWRERDPQAVFYGVLDNRTWYQLDAWSQDQFNQWKRQKMGRQVPWADPVVLELADKYSDAVVLTTDLYRDLRRRFPWLQGTQRVLQPVFETQVTFETLDYSPIPDDEVSWRAEEADLKPKGLTTPEARRALDHEWRCVEPDCLWSSARVIEADPDYDDDAVLCPECKEPAQMVGRRDQTKEVVVLHGDEEVARFPLVEGTTVVVGRGRGHDRYDVRSVLDDRLATQISRNHVQITNRAGRLFAEELGSRNGTEVVRAEGGSAPLVAGVLQVLAQGERLSAASGALNLRASGRRRAYGQYTPDLNTPPWLEEEN